jgi:transposase
MRKIREVLRLKHCGRSQREIAGSLSVSVGAVCSQLQRVRAIGLTWERAQAMSDAELEAAVFRDNGRNVGVPRAPIDFGHVHRELHRQGVTLQLLWSEYQESAAARGDNTKAYQYSHFCEMYSAWRARLKPSMRRVHPGGERAFIDYSGKKPRLRDAITGDDREVELFVMVLGASNYTYAEATWSQKLTDFVGSTIRGFEHFGGAPQVIVPDQLRSAVKGPDRYEPDINAAYLEMAQHYGTTVIPARPRRPKDKAKVEGAVLIAQRWILAKLRNATFFSLTDLNQAISQLLEELNAKPFQKLEGSRVTAFEDLDQPALRPLPALRYELTERRMTRVNIDYHVEYGGHYYSVPYCLVHEHVEVRATSTIVELFLKRREAQGRPAMDAANGYKDGERVASHPRCYGRRGASVTDSLHRPSNHQDQLWPPERLVRWAAKFGPSVEIVVEQMLARYVVVEQGYRACLGLLRLAERHPDRMDAACARALRVGIPGGPRRRYIEAILKKGLEQQPTADAVSSTLPTHENVRGGDYYDTEETMH